MSRIPVLICLLAPVLPIEAQEPVPFSVERYRALWTSKALSATPKRSAARPSIPLQQKETEWSVAGVYVFDGEPGAVLVHQKSGIAESVELGSVSPSGITLTKIFPASAGQTPRVEVLQDGSRFVLTNSTKTQAAIEPVKPSREQLPSIVQRIK